MKPALLAGQVSRLTAAGRLCRDNTTVRFGDARDLLRVSGFNTLPEPSASICGFECRLALADQAAFHVLRTDIARWPS